MTALRGITYRPGDSDFSDTKADFTQRRIIKDLPLEERPREKLLALGAEALSDGELLAILLRTGTAAKSALTLGKELTKDGGLYKRLARISRVQELTQIKGLGQAKAATVLAALELGRRLASARPLDKLHFGDGETVANFFIHVMCFVRLFCSMRRQWWSLTIILPVTPIPAMRIGS